MTEALVEVGLNGRWIAETTLRGSQEGSVTLEVPAAALATENRLEVRWRNASPGQRAWLLPDTELYLPREHRARLPDLALLRAHLYPFSLRGDLSDTVVVVPDDEPSALFPALVELAEALGRLGPREARHFRVRRAADLEALNPAGYHFILLGAQYRGFLPPSDLAASLARLPMVREGLSPWSAEHCVLSLQAASPEAVRQLVRRVFSERTLAGLRGDTAVFGDTTLYLDLAPKRELGESSHFARAQAWLRAHWLALPAVLALASVLLFLAVRITLHQYRGSW